MSELRTRQARVASTSPGRAMIRSELPGVRTSAGTIAAADDKADRVLGKLSDAIWNVGRPCCCCSRGRRLLRGRRR